MFTIPIAVTRTRSYSLTNFIKKCSFLVKLRIDFKVNAPFQYYIEIRKVKTINN